MLQIAVGYNLFREAQGLIISLPTLLVIRLLNEHVLIVSAVDLVLQVVAIVLGCH